MHLPLRALISVLSFVLLVGSSRGAAAVVERHWLQEDGLPNNIVSRVVQDLRGFLWLGTPAGLVRFDGLNFQVIALPTEKQSVRDIALAPDGSLVVLPRGGGVYILRNGNWEEHPASSLLTHETLIRVYIEPNGSVWLGGADLYRWHDGRLHTFGAENGFSREYGARYFFANDKSGITWIVAGTKLYRHRGEHLELYAESSDAAAVAESGEDGAVWLYHENRLFLVKDGRRQQVSGEADWAALGEIVCLVEDKKGALWIATRAQGVYKFSEGKLESVPVSHQRISSVFTDSESNVWLASDGGGLIRLKTKTFTLLNSSAGLQVDVSNSVSADAEGGLWLANNEGGLVRWREGVLQQVMKTSENNRRSFLVCVDDRNRVWFSMSDGLYRMPIDGSREAERVHEISGPIYGLYSDRSGRMWVSSGDQTIGYFQGDRYHPLVIEAAAPLVRVVAFAEDIDGRFWVAGGLRDLYEFSGGKIVGRPLPEWVTRVHDLHGDKRGSLWISTQNGLVCRTRDGRVETIKAEDGLPENIVLQIEEDLHGRLWFGSLRGIFNIPLVSLYRRMETRKEVLNVTTYGRNEGIVGASSFLGAPPTACRDNAGVMWFVTHRGVVGMRPDTAVSEPRSIPVYIDSVVIDRRAQPIMSADGLRIPARAGKVDFRFVALNYAAPEKVRIRHRLRGLDEEWADTGLEGRVSYGYLPPGRYIMQVAAGIDERWNEKIISMPVYVAAAWWQTWWFRAVCSLMAVAAVFVVVRHWSHRRLRSQLERLERAHALELERARIARDLHDDLGGSLTHVRLMAERLRKESAGSALEGALGLLAEYSRQMITSLEGIIWTINPRNSDWLALCDYLAGYLERVLRGSGIACAIEKESHSPRRPVSPEIQHHILSIAKEAINNVLKHSHAMNVRLILRLNAETFSFRLKDDGIGFDVIAAEESERNGLRNMRSRADEIGAELSVLSETGSGTELRLKVPLKVQEGPPSPRRLSTLRSAFEFHHRLGS